MIERNNKEVGQASSHTNIGKPGAPTSTRGRAIGVWRRFVGEERGQATVEYALVMLGAAAVAGMLLAWAVSSGVIGDLMSAVVDSVISDVTPT